MVSTYDIILSNERTFSMERIGDRLKHCRRHHGWTQRDLAQASGVGLATVRRVEQHEFAPRLETVRRLAGILRVRECWLAFGELPMLDVRHMTYDEQRKVHDAASAEQLTRDSITEHGPWYRERDTWRVDGSRVNIPDLETMGLDDAHQGKEHA
jgi:transcriptional regulator with XRE-family HTH domain